MYDCNYSEFDLSEHIKHYINYCEVCIHSDGSIHYAVPSHQQYLERYQQTKLGLTHEEFLNSVPQEYYFDYLYYLAYQTNCVIVWTQGYFGINMTEEQKDSLTQLVEAGLVRDTILKV